jgi:hypothetical protein
VGIMIRYLAPAAAGSAFAYSVERRIDEVFFDFDLGIFRPLNDISPRAVFSPLFYHDGAVTADFDYADAGEMYIIRVHHTGQNGKIVAELPLTAVGEADHVSTRKGVQHMEPSFRSGKKFFNGKVIEAKYRLTFYGNDGFTVHTATLWEDGTASCNCPQWIKKVTEERRCRHTVRALALTCNVDETGEQPAPPPPKVQRETNPFRRRSRPVDT